MLIVKKDTPLTMGNLVEWVTDFETKEKARRQVLYDFFTNKNGLKLPFAKKLVLTSASASIGNGVTLTAQGELTERQGKLFERVKDLFEKQRIEAHDKKMIIEAGATSTAYELYYMSDDEVPVPKTAKISSRQAFVVFDNTVERNSLYGVWFERTGDDYTVNVADDLNTYTIDYNKKMQDALIKSNAPLEGGVAHNIGRVPLTKGFNNDEEQADFEQVIKLIEDRDFLHDLTLADTKKIVKNILVLLNADLKGEDKEEKKEALTDLSDVPVLEIKNTRPDINPDAKMLSKNENFAMIEVFGKDIDNKIYDLSMIPNLSSEQFAGNTTGVALELKLLPFKELIRLKEENIVKIYKRRLKAYVYALTQPVLVDENIITSEYEAFDAGMIDVQIHRDWTRNIEEIARIIATLQPLGMFSEQYLTNLMPDADFDVEKERKLLEIAERAKSNALNPDANNFSIERMRSFLVGSGNE